MTPGPTPIKWAVDLYDPWSHPYLWPPDSTPRNPMVGQKSSGPLWPLVPTPGKWVVDFLVPGPTPIKWAVDLYDPWSHPYLWPPDSTPRNPMVGQVSGGPLWPPGPTHVFDHPTVHPVIRWSVKWAVDLYDPWSHPCLWPPDSTSRNPMVGQVSGGPLWPLVPPMSLTTRQYIP